MFSIVFILFSFTEMSTLLKWAQNTQGKLNSKNSQQNGEKKWIHPPEALQKGHIAYLVKFLGNTAVDQPKGKDFLFLKCMYKIV